LTDDGHERIRRFLHHPIYRSPDDLGPDETVDDT
jgi:hypothetical protein